MGDRTSQPPRERAGVRSAAQHLFGGLDAHEGGRQGAVTKGIELSEAAAEQRVGDRLSLAQALVQAPPHRGQEGALGGVLPQRGDATHASLQTREGAVRRV